MSFRDTAKGRTKRAALAAVWAACLSAPAARADEPPGGAAVAPAPAASPDSCRQADAQAVPPPPGADCTEYQLRLEQQAKRMESEVKIMEQQAKRWELFAKAKAAQEQADKKPVPAPLQNSAPPLPGAMPSGVGPGADRVLEVFGDQARIRYRGGEFLVRAGQALPQGGSVAQVSLDGVVLVEGRSRRMLPFYIGAGERQ